MANSTKKQHFVPQFYLKHFADKDGRLFCARKAGESFRSNIKDSCSINYLHEVKLESEIGFLNQGLIETRLGKLEGSFACQYDSMVHACEEREWDKAVSLGKDVLSLIIPHFLSRHTISLNEMRTFARGIAVDYVKSGLMTSAEKNRLTAAGYEHELSGLTEQFAMGALLFPKSVGVNDAASSRLEQTLRSMELSLFIAPIGSEFVTTTCPLYFIEKQNDPGSISLAYFPVSSSAAALFRDPAYGSDSGFISIDDVFSCNQMLLICNDA